MSRHYRRIDPDKRLVDLLTPSQLRFVKMTFTGASDAQIAYLTGKAVQTIKNDFNRAYRATGARNRAQLAALVWWEIEGKAKGKDNNGTR